MDMPASTFAPEGTSAASGPSALPYLRVRRQGVRKHQRAGQLRVAAYEDLSDETTIRTAHHMRLFYPLALQDRGDTSHQGIHRRH
jgi:hypothetical protein